MPDHPYYRLRTPMQGGTVQRGLEQVVFPTSFWPSLANHREPFALCPTGLSLWQLLAFVPFFVSVWNVSRSYLGPQTHTHVSWVSSNVTSYQCIPCRLPRSVSCSPSFSLYSTRSHFAVQLHFNTSIPTKPWPFQGKTNNKQKQNPPHLIYHWVLNSEAMV